MTVAASGCLDAAEVYAEHPVNGSFSLPETGTHDALLERMKQNRAQDTCALVPHALAIGGLAVAATGCEAIEGVFKAGVWVGVLMVIVVLALVGWALKSMLS